MNPGVQFHAILISQAAARRFILIRMLLPGNWTVKRNISSLNKLNSIFKSHWQ
jgi:hypothetical protein